MMDYSIIKIPRLKASVIRSAEYLLSHHPKTLRRVVLFGSCAKGTAVDGSDIDICCIFNNGTSLVSKDMRIFKANLRDIDFVDKDIIVCNVCHLQHPDMLIYHEINRTGITLLDFSHQPYSEKDIRETKPQT